MAKEAGALVVVDAVSSLGAVPLEMDDWGLDVVISGSQKALMTPPGLATAAVSAAGWEQVARSTLPSFYFNWERTRKAQEQVDSAFTPAVSLIVALDVALGLLLDGGLDDAFERHIRLGRACRAGIKAMGLELFSPDEDRSAVVTAVRMPDGMDSADLARALRDRHGVTIAGGQGELKGVIFRIGHIGWYDEFDIATALSAVELVLGELGAPIERGRPGARGVRTRLRAPTGLVVRRRGERRIGELRVERRGGSARRSRRQGPRFPRRFALRASSSCALASRWTRTPTLRSRRSSAATTRSSSARRRS